MIKLAKLEAISHKKSRMKIEDKWISYDPFLDTSTLKFGNDYEFDLSNDGTDGWVINSVNEIKDATNVAE